MAVGIDQTWHDGLPSQIDGPGGSDEREVDAVDSGAIDLERRVVPHAAGSVDDGGVPQNDGLRKERGVREKEE